MTGLIIFSVILLLILIAVNIPVEAYIRFYGGKADISVKYSFLKLFPKADKKKKQKKKKDKPLKADSADTSPDTSSEEENETADESTSDTSDSENTDKSEEKPSDDKQTEDTADTESKPEKESDSEEKPHLLDRISNKLDELEEKKNQIQLLLELILPPLKKLGGKIRIDDLLIDFAAADEDAAKAAISYGRLGAAVYNLISAIRQYIRITILSVNISCLYNTPSEKSRYDGELKIRLRPASVLNTLSAVIFGYLFNMKKYSPVMELIRKD
ncbi:MAG: hypothetical protein J6A37_11160 [Oscillospiraceae bacterium]|nr:hypothetical protein [Oscillospiraceae bacterium]